MTHKQDPIPRLRRALDEISAAGDAARLQLHLLSVQAKERGEELNSSLQALEQKVDREVQRALQSATDVTRQISEFVRVLVGDKVDAKDRTNSARSIMTTPVSSCLASDSLNRAAQIMWDRDCGCIPVVDPEGRLVGIVTDRDVCMAAYTRGCRLEDIRVSDIMVRSVHTCQADDSVRRLMTLMAEGQVRRLPVLDTERRVLGIVSLADVARNAGILGTQEAEPLVFHLLRAISKQRDHNVAERRAAE